jgi:hypothetical protein
MANETITIDQVLSASERLSTTDQLRLISLLSERLRHTLSSEDRPVDILSTSGLGAEVWQEVDVAAYLEGERASWDR